MMVCCYSHSIGWLIHVSDWPLISRFANFEGGGNRGGGNVLGVEIPKGEEMSCHSSVVFLRGNKGLSSCSGTLVAGEFDLATGPEEQVDARVDRHPRAD